MIGAPRPLWRRFGAAGILIGSRRMGEQALDLYVQSLKLEPFQNAALVNLGEILYRRGENERTREVWKKALLMHPRQPRLREAMR